MPQQETSSSHPPQPPRENLELDPALQPFSYHLFLKHVSIASLNLPRAPGRMECNEKPGVDTAVAHNPWHTFFSRPESEGVGLLLCPYQELWVINRWARETTCQNKGAQLVFGLTLLCCVVHTASDMIGKSGCSSMAPSCPNEELADP